MKVTMDENGMLTISPENPVEAFALRKSFIGTDTNEWYRRILIDAQWPRVTPQEDKQ